MLVAHACVPAAVGATAGSRAVRNLLGVVPSIPRAEPPQGYPQQAPHSSLLSSPALNQECTQRRVREHKTTLNFISYYLFIYFVVQLGVFVEPQKRKNGLVVVGVDGAGCVGRRRP